MRNPKPYKTTFIIHNANVHHSPKYAIFVPVGYPLENSRPLKLRCSLIVGLIVKILYNGYL